MNKQEQVNKLYELTEGSYSFDSYRDWKSVCRVMISKGYSVEQAEIILNSKWTRWAGDCSRNNYGKYTAKDLLNFIATQSPQDLGSLYIEGGL